jgi:hypothetical protein
METWIRRQWRTATLDLFLDACDKIEGQLRHQISRDLAMTEGPQQMEETFHGKPGACGKDLQSVTITPDNVTKVFEDTAENYSPGTYEAFYLSSSRGESSECYSESDVSVVRPKAPHAKVKKVASPSTPLVKAILRHGSDKWYELASEMGFTPSKIACITDDKPNFSGKLLAVIHVILRSVGQEKAEKILLEACQEIQPPIYQAVCDDILRDP